MATKKIGLAGAPSRDYTTVAGWITYLEGLDPFTEDEVGEHYGYTDGEETTTSKYNFNSANISNSTYKVTLQPATGEAFYDNADPDTDALIYNASLGAAIRRTSGADHLMEWNIANFELIGMQLRKDNNYAAALRRGTDVACTIKRCIFERVEGTYGGYFPFQDGAATSTATMRFENCVFMAESGEGIDVIRNSQIYFCTFVDKDEDGPHAVDSAKYGGADDIDMRCCAVFGFTRVNDSGDSGDAKFDDAVCTHIFTDSTTDPSWSSNDSASLTLTNEIQSATDARAKSGSNLDGGGTAISGITIDIYGNTRDGSTPTVGAMEIVGGAAADPFIPYHARKPGEILTRM